MSLQAPSFVLRSNNAVLRLARKGTLISRRTFAASSGRRRELAIPKFTMPTSSQTLDDLLMVFRSKVFIPASLHEPQQKLIYRESNRKLLAQSPVVVEVGDEKITLESIDRLRDEPNTKKGLHTFLALMKQRSDWNNLLPFLSGLHVAKRKLKAGVLCKIARKAIEAGRVDVVIECARQVKRTGFNLSKEDLVQQILLSLREMAMNSGWEEEATASALAHTETIITLLESSSHSGFQKGQPGDPRTSPEVMGGILEFAAVRAVKQLGAKNNDNKVRRYAQRLQAMLNSSRNIEELGTKGSPVEGAVANERLLRILPIWNGLVYAEKSISEDEEFLAWTGQSKEILMAIIKSLYEIVSKEVISSGEPRYRKAIEFYDQRAMEEK